MTAPSLDDLRASFRRSLRAARKAERTIVLYEQSIRFFCDWLAARGRPATLDEFTRANISTWLAELSDRGNEASTILTRHRGLRRFGRWLVAEGEIERAPTEAMELPVPIDRPPRVLTDDELTAILKACQVPRGKAGVYDRRIFDGRRDEVIIRLLGDCGLRVSELAALDLDHDGQPDVDLEREVAYVVGKGRRPRAVPFGARTAQALDRYLRVRALHPYAGRTTRLLLAERGPISTDGIRWRLEVLGERTGVKDLHPHALRHTFAHRWLANGGQERDLKHLAGWRSDAMLAVYARTTAVERAHAAHRRMGLGDQL